MEQSDLSLIQKFKEFFGTYMESLAVQANKTKQKQKWDHHRKMVLENSYHLTPRRYSRKEMSFLFGVTEGRVRQINRETIAGIKGKIDEVNPDIFTLYYLEDIKKLDSYLQSEGVWPKNKFYNYLNEKYQIDIEQEKPFVNLLLDVLGYKIAKTPFYIIKDNEMVFFDKTIDRNLFFKICHAIFIALEKNAVPTEVKDVIISVNRDLKPLTTDHSLIEKALNVVGDVEPVVRDEAKLYQVAFHRLSSSADMACRILFEQENWMKLQEIGGEIDRRLGLKNKKSIDLRSLYTAMKKDRRLLSFGKSGIWTLTEWGGNDPGVCGLITNTLLLFNEPMSKEDLFAHIHETLPFIPISLLNLNINNSRFAQLKDTRFILAEWKDLYKGKIAIIKKGNKHLLNEQNHVLIKEQILKLFAANELDKLPLTNIVNTVSQNYKFPKQLIYRRIRVDTDFKTVKTDGQKGKQVIFASKLK
jgi:hypothetical protein